MPAEPAELWAFYLAAATVAVILVVTAGAAVIVAQRKITAAMRDFAARQVAALEEERGRVARELHDDVSQQIAVLSHRLDAIQEALRLQANEPELLFASESVRGGLRRLAESVRVLAHRMHPSALDHLGLGPALRDLAREAGGDTSCRITVEVESEASEPAPQHSLALYRVAQEALRNVRRHSGAKQALVRVVQSEDGTTLIIWDDGAGFVTEHASRSAGLGMVSMRERLRLVGGELSISSAPGEGTTVRARVPRGIGAGE